MAGTIDSQHKEGDIVVRWRKAQPSALAKPVAVCAALLSMLGKPNFKITRPIRLENFMAMFCESHLMPGMSRKKQKTDLNT